MIKTGIGRSAARDTIAAAEEAGRLALAQVPDPGLILLFATSGHDQAKVVAEIRRLAPHAALTGCSAEGVITQGRSDEDECSIGVLALGGDQLAFDTFLVDNYGTHSAQAGTTLGQQVARANVAKDGICLLVFTEGLRGDCTAFLEALSHEIPGLPVAGGVSADALRMEETYQYCNDRVVTGGVSAVLLRGAGRVEVAVSHGCSPVGRRMTVTGFHDGWIETLDGRPAWDVFREYLFGDPQDLNADGIMHLCVSHRGQTPDLAESIRAPMQLRKSDGALFFPGGGLRLGDTVRMVRRDQDRIRQSASDAAEAVRNAAGGEVPDLVLQFDCCGRGKLLFGANAVQEIVAPLQDKLGKQVPWIGFHSYGEIAPLKDKLCYHNYTVAIVALFARRAHERAA